MTRSLASRFVLPTLGIFLLLSLLVPDHIQRAFTAGGVPSITYVTFSGWERVSEMPALAPQGSGWEAAGTFNPTVISPAEWIGRTDKPRYILDGSYVMLYRAQDANGISRIGYASAFDVNFFYLKRRLDDPVLSPEAEYEKDGGIEDPRLLKIGDTFYLTYTGYNKKDAQLCLATSRDLLHWDRKGVIVPANRGNWNVKWTKSGAIVPQKINGKYWMYWLGTAADGTDQMGLSSSMDLLHWTEETAAPVLPRREGRFDSRVVEPGPPPIVVRDRIVLVYNGADDHLVYRTGVANFDVRDPRKLMWRTDEPIFQPEKDWEKAGQVPNVVFVEGMTRTSTAIVKPDDEFLFYYGAADKYVGVARARLRIRSLAAPN